MSTNHGHRVASSPANRSQYELRAARYDTELIPFEPFRVEAISRLALHPGERALDIGCGTGLSLPALDAAVRSHGEVLAVEPCSAMRKQAEARVRRLGLTAIHLQEATAESCAIEGLFDAALLHFTHDVLRSPAAVSHLMAHLRPGARIAATGLQWAPPWAIATNCFVWAAALYSTRSLEGLAAPWDSLRPYLDELVVDTYWGGSIFIASGRRNTYASAAPR